MQSSNITLVSGSAGAGKTTWIRQQMNAIPEAVVYISLGAGHTPIDKTYLATEISELTTLNVEALTDCFVQPLADAAVYVELGFHIDLTTLALPEQMTDCRRVAVVPPGPGQQKWQDWADLVVPGVESSIVSQPLHLWHSVLSGQVLDPASLNTFWYELTNGAYGRVHRAKGIFDVVDGRSFYFNFVDGLAETTYLDLKLPRWLNGRPDRFSGIEVVGDDVTQEGIAQALKDCSLEDQIILYYQQQIKGSLESGDVS